MTGAATRRPGLVVLGTIGVAVCCALPGLAGLGALTGIGTLWGPAAAIVLGALGVVVAFHQSRRHPARRASSQRRQQSSAERGEN